MNTHVYSLLHIAPNQFSRKNLGGTFEKSIGVYFKNAITLQKSLKQIDLEFTLVTNNVQYLIDNFPELVPKLDILEIEFSFAAPTESYFYSSHFMFDVFRYLAEKHESYSIYLDLDVISINSLSTTQRKAFADSRCIALDYTKESIGDWKLEIQSDLLLTRGKMGEVKWFGGEYLSGNSKFFEAINTKVSSLSANYSKNIGAIHHKGNETLLTSAILELESDGWVVDNATNYALIARIWDIPFRKQRQYIAQYHSFTFVHLPNHKVWLAELSNVEFEIKKVFRQFCIKSNSRLLIRALNKFVSLFDYYKKPKQQK